MSGRSKSKISREKADIVLRLFLRTGDEDYIASRWCATNGLTGNFFWHSAQTIEKYFKVILLLEGCSVRSQKHNLSALYLDVSRNCPEILPMKLKAHDVLRNNSLGEMETEKFISLMAQMGSPTNRYLANGYFYKPEYLYWLDGLIFASRKLISNLYYVICDGSNGKSSISSNQSPTAEAIDVVRQLIVGRLDSLVSASFDSELRKAFLNRNEFFAPANYEHAVTSEVLVSMSSSGTTNIFDMLRAGDKATMAKGIEFAKWLLDSTYNERNSKMALEELVKEAEKRLASD